MSAETPDEPTIDNTPRPTPKFMSPERGPFSAKSRVSARSRRHYSNAQTAPQLAAPSRVCAKRFQRQRPSVVRFEGTPRKCESDAEFRANPFYDKNVNASYFKQCFEMVKKLGQGSFGEVFHVIDKRDGRHYAVKRCMNAYRSEVDRAQKLEEARKHAEVPPHLNILEFVRAWEESGRLYIQTELCETSLDAESMRNARGLPELTVWRYLVDILSAMAHLHALNLVHTDIKPENILIDRYGICKLGDFGLLTALSGSLREVPEGDCKYLAPELLSNQFGTHSDVFSAAITVLDIATEVDIPPNGPAWTILRHGKLPEDFVRHLSPTLQELMTKMMQRDPKKRPTAAEILEMPSIAEHVTRRRAAYRIVRARRQAPLGCARLICSLSSSLSILLARSKFAPEYMQHTPPRPSALIGQRQSLTAADTSLRTPACSRTDTCDRTPSPFADKIAVDVTPPNAASTAMINPLTLVTPNQQVNAHLSDNYAFFSAATPVSPAPPSISGSSNSSPSLRSQILPPLRLLSSARTPSPAPSSDNTDIYVTPPEEPTSSKMPTAAMVTPSQRVNAHLCDNYAFFSAATPVSLAPSSVDGSSNASPSVRSSALPPLPLKRADADEPTAKKRRLDMERVCKSESQVNKGVKRVQRRGKGCSTTDTMKPPQHSYGTRLALALALQMKSGHKQQSPHLEVLSIECNGADDACSSKSRGKGGAARIQRAFHMQLRQTPQRMESAAKRVVIA